jgi:sec-independent protein translocase protein TatC
MIFSHYFFELKIRFIYYLINLLSFILLFYLYIYEILYLINYNPTNLYFIFTNLSEVFSIYIYISLIGGLTLSIPYLFLQILWFLYPCLYIYELKIIKKVFKNGISLIIISNTLFFYIIFPWSWAFFLGFETTIKKTLISIFFENKIKEYLIFFSEFLFLYNFLVLFSIIVYYILTFLKNIFIIRKFVYIFIIIVGGLLSPPDIFSQLIISLPIIIIYEIILIFNLFFKNYLKRKPIKTN